LLGRLAEQPPAPGVMRDASEMPSSYDPWAEDEMGKRTEPLELSTTELDTLRGAKRLLVDAVTQSIRLQGELVRLTKREHEVLLRVLHGQRTKALASETGMTEKTAKHHIRHIFDKFRVGTRAELSALLCFAPELRILKQEPVAARLFG
jgi:DNA-binding CsgD family transcriptional regulator